MSKLFRFIYLKLIFCLLLCSVILILLSSCQTKEPIYATGIYFDTVVTIQLYGTKDQTLLTECMQMCKDFESRFDRTDPASEISKINTAKGTPVTVSDDTANLIREGLSYCGLSGGAFDITIAPLNDLWNFKNNTGTVPSQESINAALSHVDYRNVILAGNTVTLKDPEAALDLGGIAKGYIADCLKEYLISKEVEHATINLGGNVLVIGDNLDNKPFHIGIAKPFDDKNVPITSVYVTDRAVTSSGNYQRYFEADGKIYHHILNPKTGYPYENSLYGVTILSDTSTQGDGLSTVCFALGFEQGMQLIQSLDDVEAIFITDDYELHDSRTQLKEN